MMNTHDIENEKLLLKEDDHVEIELFVPAGSDYFDGHFPNFKLLPAVAQFEIVVRFARRYFMTSHFIPRIRRMKFSSPILPDSRVWLKMLFHKEKESVTFELADAADHSKLHSSGSFSITMKEVLGEEEKTPL